VDFDLVKQEIAMQDKLRLFKANFFQALSHPSRIAIVELLRDGSEIPVTVIYEQLGLEQANVSQHLALLRATQIVVARKAGNQVFYSLRDRIIGKVLDLMRQYFHAHLEESLELLEDIRSEERAYSKSGPRVKRS
jgi:ArsR family transcriptional regulator